MQPHVVVAGIVLDDGRVLLCHRSPQRRWYPDVWDLPGGHVDGDEPSTDALRRELLEELGIVINEIDSEPVSRIARPATDLDLTVFVVRAWSGTPKNLQPEEHDDMAWFCVQDLHTLKLADDAYLPLLKSLLEGTD